MNTTTSTATPPRDLFFRLADRLQIDACLQAIEQDGKSVILHSVSPGLLDHYSQILVQRLRQRMPQTPTEIFFPTHTEALIERFNGLLENVSIDDATQTGEPRPPQKLWVVHDASALPEHELKLLIRLLQHLPGARVSAVLILNGQATALRNLDPQGRRLLRWEIEPPSPEQIEQTVQEARQMGREFAALELIARLQPAQATAGSLPQTPAPASPRVEKSTGTPAPITPDAASVPEAASKQANQGPRWGMAAAIITGLLMLSVGTAVWLHPDTFKSLLTPSKTASASPETSPAVPEASSPALDASTAAPQEASAPQESASAPSVQSPAQEPAPQASAPAAAVSSTSNWITELPDVALRGQQWLRQLDKEVWVVEHGRHASVQGARKQMASDVLLTNARIVPVGRADTDAAQFLVITGPFRSQERARTFITRHELGRSASIISREALLEQTPTAAPTRRRP